MAFGAGLGVDILLRPPLDFVRFAINLNPFLETLNQSECVLVRPGTIFGEAEFVADLAA